MKIGTKLQLMNGKSLFLIKNVLIIYLNSDEILYGWRIDVEMVYL